MISDFIIIDGILTPQECIDLINEGEKDPSFAEELDLGDSKFARITWKKPKLSQLVWDRFKNQIAKRSK